MLKFIKFAKIEDIPDELDIPFGWYLTQYHLIKFVGKEFEDEAKSMCPGTACIIVDIPEEYEDEADILKLVEVSSETRACTFPHVSPIRKPKPRINMEASFQLMAPIAVTFKMSELPTDFPGNLHKFKDKDYMCRVMSDDYIGFESTPDSIEPGVYYICLVLLQDYQGKLDYDYFIKNLEYEKLTAYYLEKGEKPAGQEKGKELTFRYKNEHYDK